MLLDQLVAKEAPSIVQISTAKLHPFPAHPFKVQDDEDMEQLTQSIQAQGVLTPLVVRPLENGEYEVISGHRRLHACRRAGIQTVPALVYAIDRDAAAIALVDSNLHRERILPSEKAFAYKLKMDALSKQGKRTDLTSDQVGPKLTAATLSSDDSASQVKRYIRLTNLIPGILEKVDEGRISLTPAVELSYLTETEQKGLLETMESEDCTPSLTQAIQLKQASLQKTLNMDMIFAILRQPKANQQEKIVLKVNDIRRFFPQNYTTIQMTNDIMKGLELLRKQRARSKDAR
ncbi:MAG: ParB/RepB/Spo0J family partition protein [Oscillospiraceae bacterium]|nr:ParB/RepB/Spo0J family partition protein [Oscillospiraceae bacterium]